MFWKHWPPSFCWLKCIWLWGLRLLSAIDTHYKLVFIYCTSSGFFFRRSTKLAVLSFSSMHVFIKTPVTHGHLYHLRHCLQREHLLRWYSYALGVTLQSTWLVLIRGFLLTDILKFLGSCRYFPLKNHLYLAWTQRVKSKILKQFHPCSTKTTFNG